MRRFKDLNQFARFLESAQRRAADTRRKAMQMGAELIATEMRREIGRYQDADGPFPAWRKLAPRTLADKRRRNEAPPDNPLKASGSMQEAVGASTQDDGRKSVAGVKASRSRDGTLAPVAVWQERGTKGPHAGEDGFHVPPRSFVARSAYRRGEDAVRLIGREIIGAIAGVRIDDRSL